MNQFVLLHLPELHSVLDCIEKKTIFILIGNYEVFNEFSERWDRL